MKRIPLFLLVIPMLLFISCDEERQKDASKNKSTGATAEVLVVIEDELWKGQGGEAIREVLLQDIPVMPWGEQMFDIVQMSPEKFAQMYQRHHSIIIAQLDGSLDSAKVETKDDYWAAPQRLIRLRAPNAASLAEAFRLRQDNIVGLLREADRARLTRLFTEFQNTGIKKRIMEQMGLRLVVPSGFYVAKLTPEFAWLRKETKDWSQGLIIYFTPYEDTSYFNTQLIINRRDQMCMLYIPGELEGTYMQTATAFAPESERINFKGHFAVETRGLWDVKGDFMGGPFLNYAILDEEKNRIVSIDGYTYFPNNDKRDLMLQLEAAMYTLELDLESEGNAEQRESGEEGS